MGFYLIGLGLNEKSVSLEALEIIKKCSKVYLESYTIEFPYEIPELEKVLGREVDLLDRDKVEGEDFVLDGKSEDICLLVYGSPMMATTHVSLLERCKKEKIKYNIVQNASIFDAVAETGLHAYKFGKTASLIKSDEKVESIEKIIKDNLGIGAHSLILVDIGLSFGEAVGELKKYHTGKIVVCSKMGTDEQKIVYGDVDGLKNEDIKAPFCFIIPSGDLHFGEAGFLKTLN
ncbi:MAG: diphthine synthase [Nanoarchaeota archaeon]|nr:diphthine synthase [Nanoarchaeota archaeon]